MVPTKVFPKDRVLASLLGIAALVCGSVAVEAQGASPFSGFSGTWSGGGDVNLTDGSHEKVRCKAEYSVSPSGENLHISMNCASDSFKVQVISNVVADGNGGLSGVWRETTRQGEGSVSGQVVGPGQLSASLDGTAYGIQLTVNTKGNQQSVAIQAQGTDVQSVRISLRRG